MILIRILSIAAFSAIPFGMAFLADRDLSSAAHLPVIGVAGICVSLCDALCGQIISNTRWIPFNAYHTPSQAQRLVAAFKKYHREMIFKWMAAKSSSAIVVMLSAIMAMQKCPGVFAAHRFAIFTVGYILLGFSMSMALSFILSYFRASDESNRARLEEMNYAYQKEHPELYANNSELIKRQLEGFGSGYTSKPQTAETVR